MITRDLNSPITIGTRSAFFVTYSKKKYIICSTVLFNIRTKTHI